MSRKTRQSNSTDEMSENGDYLYIYLLYIYTYLRSCSDEGLTLETSVHNHFHGVKLIYINLKLIHYTFIYLPTYLSICLSVCLSVYLSTYLFFFALTKG